MWIALVGGTEISEGRAQSPAGVKKGRRRGLTGLQEKNKNYVAGTIGHGNMGQNIQFLIANSLKDFLQ